MKKVLLIVAFIFTSLLNSASISENEKNLFTEDFVEQTSGNFYQINDAICLPLKDCTIRLDFELGDGSTIQGEITFVDVSWWDCTKMQLAAWWERNF